jgi:hypothetical protein
MELFLASNMLGFVLQCENFVKIVLHSFQLDISFFSCMYYLINVISGSWHWLDTSFFAVQVLVLNFIKQFCLTCLIL